MDKIYLDEEGYQNYLKELEQISNENRYNSVKCSLVRLSFYRNNSIVKSADKFE